VYPPSSVVPPRSDSLMYVPSYSMMGAAPTRSGFSLYADLSSVPPQQRMQSAIKGFNERGLSSVDRGLSMIAENISESQSLTVFDRYVSEVLLPGLPPPPLDTVAPGTSHHCWTSRCTSCCYDRR